METWHQKVNYISQNAPCLRNKYSVCGSGSVQYQQVTWHSNISQSALAALHWRHRELLFRIKIKSSFTELTKSLKQTEHMVYPVERKKTSLSFGFILKVMRHKSNVGDYLCWNSTCFQWLVQVFLCSCWNNYHKLLVLKIQEVSKKKTTFGLLFGFSAKSKQIYLNHL